MGTAAADARLPAHGKGWHTAPGCTCVVSELLGDAVVLELLDDARLPALGTGRCPSLAAELVGRCVVVEVPLLELSNVGVGDEARLLDSQSAKAISILAGCWLPTKRPQAVTARERTWLQHDALNIKLTC